MRRQDSDSPGAPNGEPVPVARLVAGALAAVTTGNPHRIQATAALRRAGLTLEDVASNSIVPACCDHGCRVATDGHCQHACPSVLIALGLI